ncbi:hypothetical protein F5883DRAFT_209993 [Diaporthe sp. PMI_573]|nr:hypothetical protein F5883DRAFT_209993 [Diaporthaceae sp. PMI_573]
MSSMLPFLEVSNLAASSSFYSTVTHPLGLRYISAASPSPDLPGSPSIVYGIATTSPPVPVFELRQVRPTAERPLKLSRAVFSAASPAAVRDFRALVQRIKAVDTGAIGFGDHPQLEEQASGAELAQQSGGGPDSTETDLDGNIIKMEVVYVPPVQDYPEWYSGPTVRKTQSTQSEASRILHWNYDVAADSAASMSFAPLSPASQSLVSPREPGRYDERPSLLRRSVTTTTTLLEPADPESSSQSPSQGSRGLSAVGAALMGVAAGAALGAGITYSVVRGSQDFEPPMAQRRSTFPRQYSDSRSRRDDGASVADRRPPPTLLTRHSYSQAPSARNRDSGVDLDDARSRHSSRSRPAGTPSVRTRSEVSTSRKPLLLTDVASRSHASSRSSARTAEMEDILGPGNPRPTSSRYSTASRTSKHPPSVRRSSTYDGPVVDSYSCVSAGSYRTQSTVRPPPAPQPEHVPRAPSKAPSKAPSRAASKAASRAGGPSNSRVSAVTAWPSGRAESYVSARHVPLPPSGVGNSYVDDDLESLAPSDSISCVGSRRSERLYQ